MRRSPVRIEDFPVKPLSIRLDQHWPNPFNPFTTISFDLPKAAQVVLRVYDGNGREVRTLVDRRLDVGPHLETWDALDDAGNASGSGIYYCRLFVDGRTITRKMVLLR